MKVLSVRNGTLEGYPNWLLISVEGKEGEWMVGRNWEAANGDLKVGDDVEFGQAKSQNYPGCPYASVSGLRRVGKEPLVE